MENGALRGTRSYALTSYRDRDRFRPKTCRSGRRSHPLESRVIICQAVFVFVEIWHASQMNGACPTTESSSGVFPRRKGKVNVSFIENRRKFKSSESESQDRGRDVFTFRTWSWRLPWESDSLGGATPGRANTRGSYGTLRKLGFHWSFSNPNHWRKLVPRVCRRFSTHICFTSHSVHLSWGRKRGGYT